MAVAGDRIEAIVVVIIVLTIFADPEWSISRSEVNRLPVDIDKDPSGETLDMRPKLRSKSDRSVYLVTCSPATQVEIQWSNDEAGHFELLYVPTYKTAESCKVAMSISSNDDEMFRDVPLLPDPDHRRRKIDAAVRPKLPKLNFCTPPYNLDQDDIRECRYRYSYNQIVLQCMLDDKT